jgi:hypothetical protein
MLSNEGDEMMVEKDLKESKEGMEAEGKENRMEGIEENIVIVENIVIENRDVMDEKWKKENNEKDSNSSTSAAIALSKSVKSLPESDNPPKRPENSSALVSSSSSSECGSKHVAVLPNKSTSFPNQSFYVDTSDVDISDVDTSDLEEPTDNSNPSHPDII